MSTKAYNPMVNSFRMGKGSKGALVKIEAQAKSEMVMRNNVKCHGFC